MNWVRHLPKYTAILNDDHKSELGWKTPLEVYFGRKKNTAACISKTKNPTTELIQRNNLLYPTESDVSDFEHMRKDIRSTASNATRHCNQQMVLKGLRTTVYETGDKVLVRYRNDQHNIVKRHYVPTGIIQSCNYELHRYKIKFTQKNSAENTVRWFSVADITSVTRHVKKIRGTQPQKRTGTAARRKYYIPYQPADRLDIFRAEGFSVQLDPTPDGNCQFEAMADQLRRIGIYRSITSLRREIVNDLQRRATTSDGTSLEFRSRKRHTKVSGRNGQIWYIR